MPAATVSETVCQMRLKTTRRLITTTLTICSLLAVTVDWARWESIVSNDQVEAVSQKTKTYIAKNEERSKAIKESLTRIETTQIRIATRLDKIFENRAVGGG